MITEDRSLRKSSFRKQLRGVVDETMNELLVSHNCRRVGARRGPGGDHTLRERHGRNEPCTPPSPTGSVVLTPHRTLATILDNAPAAAMPTTATTSITVTQTISTWTSIGETPGILSDRSRQAAADSVIPPEAAQSNQ